MTDDLDRAARAIRGGDLVAYPTETVYGLGADATDPAAVEAVFAAKGRDRSNPVSLGVPDVATAEEYVAAGERERAFMREFLPGPVTVVCERRAVVPDALTGGRDRVGVRVPDHDLALALYERAGTAVTATSANVSGRDSVVLAANLDPEIRDAVAAVIGEVAEWDGATAGAASGEDGRNRVESTVVDVERGEIHRRGALADEIEAWLDRR